MLNLLAVSLRVSYGVCLPYWLAICWVHNVLHAMLASLYWAHSVSAVDTASASQTQGGTWVLGWCIGCRALRQVIGGGCHLDRPTVDALEGAFDSVHVLGVVDSQLIPVVYGTAYKK